MDFDILNYEIFIPNCIRIPILSSEFVHRCWSGSVIMVRFSHSIEKRKHFIIAKLTIWVWCGVAIINGQILWVFTDAC